MSVDRFVTAAAVLAIGGMLLLYVWFWSTHGFVCPDGSDAVQRGTWPFHQMVCRP